MEAVARARDVDEIDLPPLYEAVDPDALDRFVTPEGDGADVRVRFSYAGRDIVVSPGTVEVRPAGSEPGR